MPKLQLILKSNKLCCASLDQRSAHCKWSTPGFKWSHAKTTTTSSWFRLSIHPKGKKKTCSGRTSANDLGAKDNFCSFNTRNKNYAWLHFTGWTFGLHSLSAPLAKGHICITARQTRKCWTSFLPCLPSPDPWAEQKKEEERCAEQLSGLGKVYSLKVQHSCDKNWMCQRHTSQWTSVLIV